MRARPIFCAGVLALVLAACEREERVFRPNPVATETQQEITQSTLSPGPGGPIEAENDKGDDYRENAYLVAEGKRLFSWFNCKGCHFNGGGGIGPPLMDDEWIYGAEMENIVQTIKEGRPNGMPAFRGRIPDDQVWQIAAYVQSMSGMLRKDVATGRSDDIQGRPPENETPPSPLLDAVEPSPAEQTR